MIQYERITFEDAAGTRRCILVRVNRVTDAIYSATRVTRYGDIASPREVIIGRPAEFQREPLVMNLTYARLESAPV